MRERKGRVGRVVMVEGRQRRWWSGTPRTTDMWAMEGHDRVGGEVGGLGFLKGQGM